VATGEGEVLPGTGLKMGEEKKITIRVIGGSRWVISGKSP
jgi:hypothetical protein